jgi:hypothetical protein
MFYYLQLVIRRTKNPDGILIFNFVCEGFKTKAYISLLFTHTSIHVPTRVPWLSKHTDTDARKHKKWRMGIFPPRCANSGTADKPVPLRKLLPHVLRYALRQGVVSKILSSLLPRQAGWLSGAFENNTLLHRLLRNRHTRSCRPSHASTDFILPNLVAGGWCVWRAKLRYCSPFNAETCLFNIIRTQSVPRSKHSPPRLYTTNLLVHKAKVAVFPESYTKHTNAMWQPRIIF